LVDVPLEIAGALVMLVMVLLILLGVPVAIAMIAAGAFGIVSLSGMPVLVFTLRDYPFQSSASWSLSVLPMFILMGFVLYRSGLSEELFRSARLWLGRFPGGMAVATNASGAGMSAVSGSTMGISYAIGKVALPEMAKMGYNPKLATG